MRRTVPVPCLEPGCGQLTLKGNRCIEHYLAQQRARNKRPLRVVYQDPAYLAAPSSGICWICKNPGADSRDHVVSISEAFDQGWSIAQINAPSNLRPAHKRCNSWKGKRRLA